MLPRTNKPEIDISTETWLCKFNSIFEDVFNHSLVGMAILDSQGKFIKLNKKACDIWEYSEEELLTKTWKDITHPDDVMKSTHYVDSYKGKSSNYNQILEKRYITGCGNTKICRITTTAKKDKNDNIEYFFTQIEDITQKKEAILFITKFLKRYSN